MNKMLIGVIVIVLGGVVGLYMFRGNTGGKLPGMQIGDQQIIPALTGTPGAVSISDESTAVGSEKGGISNEAVVTYTDAGYSPKEITVKKGTKVTFKNEGASSMWTASGTHPTHQLLPGFDALKSVAKGGIYEYTFTKVGRWQFHNHVNAVHEGIVIVVE